jgi:MoaA/NifB/PqqE/SkfB family radical SAM enzyme
MPTPPLPMHLQMEVTGACNLRCQMCLVGHRSPLGRRSASLDLASFRRLLDELPDVESLTLQGLGEPLLAPGLLDMVSLAKARRIRVGFNTNGMLLDARHRRALLDLEVDWVHVSVDAPRRRSSRRSAPAPASNASWRTCGPWSPSAASGPAHGCS